MAGDRWNKERRNRLPPFVPLLVGTIESPAWFAMSHGAKVLYMSLKRRYNQNNHNNGRIFLSQRTAVKELRSHHNQIARWFRELRHYGFIVMTQPGCLGVEGKGKSTTLAAHGAGLYEGLSNAGFFAFEWSQIPAAKIKSPCRKACTQCAGKPSHHRAGKTHRIEGKRAGMTAQASGRSCA
jgi:hypothetical protein